MKRVLVKDFNSFSNRHAGADRKTDRLGSDNLFMAKNPMWKALRSRLVPLFTGAKLRHMFVLMNEVGKEFNKYLCDQKVNEKTQSMRLDMKDMFARYSTDIIATCAYGIKANSIQDTNAPFRVNGRKIFEMNPLRAIESASFFLLPEIVSFFRFKFFAPNCTEFLRESFNSVLRQREQSGEVRNDLIDALLALKREDENSEKGKDELRFDGDVLVAQAAIFFTGGFETSSTTMSFGLLELAWKVSTEQLMISFRY